MKKILKTITTLALFAGLSGPALAVFIDGEVTVGAQSGVVSTTGIAAGQVDYVGGGGPDGATGVLISPGAGVVGDYSGIIGNTVNLFDFTFSPTLSPSPAKLWEDVGNANNRFEMTAVNVDFQSSSFLNLSGEGIAYLDTFDPTPGVFTFTATKSGTEFQFSATNDVPIPSVPDGGVTASLLGLALLGLGGVRRFLCK